ncbi:hypothetical protein CVT24_009895 [Panaeolus cyanescens]|uniref:SAP domain-containing protein n=1 Tax=Panaeolus cyanescens TaxID=181874 RepID=A0A409WWB0_9AGAR|nr:hypothetical protein CVT24_009895 [Panaeolus cyanescens]
MCEVLVVGDWVAGVGLLAASSSRSHWYYPSSVIALVRELYTNSIDSLIWLKDLVNGPNDLANEDAEHLLNVLQTLHHLDTILSLLFYIILALSFIFFDSRYRNLDQRIGQTPMDEDMQVDIPATTGTTGQDKAAAPMDIENAGDHNLDSNLPLPSSNDEIQYIDINGANKPQLQELCRSCRLPVKGNKDDLKARLRSYSKRELREVWIRLNEPNAHRMHRGPRDGGISKSKPVAATKKKKNTAFIRAEAMFGGSGNDPAPHQRLTGNQIEQQTAPSLEQQSKLLKWADEIVEKSPRISKVDRDKLREEETARNVATAKLAPPLEKHLASIQDGIKTMLAQTSTANTSICISTPNSTVDTASEANTMPPINSTHPLSSRSSSVSSNTSSESSAATQQSGFEEMGGAITRTIQLGNGRTISVVKDDIPNPPALTFSNEEISLLNGMWDYTSPHWQDTSPLIVKNMRIPIKYWRDLYNSRTKLPSGKQWKEGQWKGVKSCYGKWRIIVARWRRLSQEEFWQDFTLPDGSRMVMSTMTAQLATIRAREDAKHAEEARHEYGNDFSATFGYFKHGKYFIKTRNSDIAKQYRKIKNIKTDWDSDDDDVN